MSIYWEAYDFYLTAYQRFTEASVIENPYGRLGAYGGALICAENGLDVLARVADGFLTSSEVHLFDELTALKQEIDRAIKTIHAMLLPS